MTLVIIDAENVRRSRWPNLSLRSSLRRSRVAEREDHELWIVFDGEPPNQTPDLVVQPYADDELALRGA